MILMHVTDNEKEMAVRYTADKIGEEVVTIGSGELDRVVMSFFAGKETRRSVKIPPLYVMPEVLVFIGFDDAKLDSFLRTYRSLGVKPVALKAVSTMHNAGWTIFELIEHLKEEHQGRA